MAGNVWNVQMSQALVRIAAGWLLGLMLAVAGAVVAVNLVNNTVASPQQPVREYLDALQSGDGTIGRLLEDPAVYEEMQAAIATLRRLMADIQANPGRYIGELRAF